MSQRIANINLLVRDYEEALSFYTTCLGFEIAEDIDNGEGRRWIRLLPRNSQDCALVLCKAETPLQQEIIGKQAGDAVLMILFTDNFQEDYDHMKAQGVVFLEEPRVEPYGTVVIFQDLYGNKWDLLEPR
ncbi:VOC family protein [Algivirga pacifica]|uniref:VOC family protein n=1 Tax=Algivirga pacifica TaxID=1162670 RepID=A0ABP9DJI0_9BACT